MTLCRVFIVRLSVTMLNAVMLSVVAPNKRRLIEILPLFIRVISSSNTVGYYLVDMGSMLLNFFVDVIYEWW
jgi:hypothetical protein